MKITLLLDLDNTLLGNDMEKFLPVYFQALSQNFPEWTAEEFINKLLAATQVMISKNQHSQTLEQVFDRVFYPSLGMDKEKYLHSTPAGVRMGKIQSLSQQTAPLAGDRKT